MKEYGSHSKNPDGGSFLNQNNVFAGSGKGTMPPPPDHAANGQLMSGPYCGMPSYKGEKSPQSSRKSK